MILVLDCGNSRLKWGLAGPHGWVSQGNVPNQEIGTLALRDWQNLPRPARVVGVNVAGEATRVRVEAQLVRWRTPPERNALGTGPSASRRRRICSMAPHTACIAPDASASAVLIGKS